MTRRRRTTLALIAVVGAVPAAGCYRHVVGAKGFGATGARIHEANAPDTSSDRQRSLLKRDSGYIPEK